MANAMGRARGDGNGESQHVVRCVVAYMERLYLRDSLHVPGGKGPFGRRGIMRGNMHKKRRSTGESLHWKMSNWWVLYCEYLRNWGQQLGCVDS